MSTRSTITITTTATEEEPDGWVFTQGDYPVGIQEGWSHDHPSHEDQWPEVTLIDHGAMGEAVPFDEAEPQWTRGPMWERFVCTGCGSVLVHAYVGMADQDRPL